LDVGNQDILLEIVKVLALLEDSTILKVQPREKGSAAREGLL
jgi:hypothetical protein